MNFPKNILRPSNFPTSLQTYPHFDDGGPLANNALAPCSAARLQGYGGPNAGGLPILVQLLTDPPLLPLHQVEAASITGRRRLLLERSRRSMWCMILRPEQCRSGSHRPKLTPGTRRDRDFARDHARNPEIASDCTTPISRFLSGSWVKAEEAKKNKKKHGMAVGSEESRLWMTILELRLKPSRKF